jgi:uncharacterized membrane protein
MNWPKVLTYGVIALVALFLLRIAVGAVLGFFGFLWTAITTGVTLLAIGGLLYAGYRLWSWVSEDESSSASDSVGASTSTEDRVETLKRRYAEGELTEDEFERRLGQELGGPSMDRLDRQLNRERE